MLLKDLSESEVLFLYVVHVVSQGIVFDDEVFDPHHCMYSGSNTLTPQKARVLLMLALAYTHDLDKIKELFNEY